MKVKISLFKSPSAFLPILMSLAALVLVVSDLTIYGVGHRTDEGAAAHIWQILIICQGFIAVFFAIKYLPLKPKQTLLIMAIQIIASIAACTPVFLFRL